MTRRAHEVPPRLALLLWWILAAVTSGCAGTSEFAAAKSAPVATVADSSTAEAEAPSEPGAPPAAPETASLAGLDESYDEKPTAELGQTGPAKREVSDAPSPTPRTAGTPTAQPGPPAATREPLLIYTAIMTLGVYGAREAIAAVEELARTSGGYLVSRTDDSVTIRVPTKLFLGALGGVSKLGDELHREVNVRDVTEQYADLEVRLKNAEAVRLRLEALLAKAGRIEEALAVERELERLTQTIEQLKGRLRLLNELVAFSTITVNFRARPQDQVGSEVRLPFPWLNELGLVPLMKLEEQ